MTDFILVHDPDSFARLSPLADAWRLRSFLPCRPFANPWADAALAYAERFHINPDDLLLPRLETLRFDRTVWRAVVSEVLFVTALDIPQLPPHAEGLTHLLAPDQPDLDRRSSLAPFHQALHGSRDLTLGVVTYRPGRAGRNDADDVARLSAYLDAIHPEEWASADLAGLADLDVADRAVELDYAREWLAGLADLYRHAAGEGCVLAFEGLP